MNRRVNIDLIHFQTYTYFDRVKTREARDKILRSSLKLERAAVAPLKRYFSDPSLISHNNA